MLNCLKKQYKYENQDSRACFSLFHPIQRLWNDCRYHGFFSLYLCCMVSMSTWNGQQWNVLLCWKLAQRQKKHANILFDRLVLLYFKRNNHQLRNEWIFQREFLNIRLSMNKISFIINSSWKCHFHHPFKLTWNSSRQHLSS